MSEKPKVIKQMPETLTDVKCLKCGRAIGQRNGSLFVQFGMKTKFNKTARIYCPFINCGFEQDFPVNRESKTITKPEEYFASKTIQ